MAKQYNPIFRNRGENQQGNFVTMLGLLILHPKRKLSVIQGLRSTTSSPEATGLAW
jgi:hypothetical protein